MGQLGDLLVLTRLLALSDSQVYTGSFNRVNFARQRVCLF